jgi:recombination protein RecA
MGLQARLMSQALRKLTAIIGKSRTILIFINQIRMKIGVKFGNPETTTGGNALKFYASLRLEVRKTDTIETGAKGESDAIGNRVRVKVVKNKVASPFRRAELEIIFGKGVSYIASLLDAAVKCEIIDKKGAWFAYKDEKIGQGRENVKVYLESNPEIAKEIEAQVRVIFFPKEAEREEGKKDKAEKTAGKDRAGEKAEQKAPEAEDQEQEQPAKAAEIPEQLKERRGPGRPPAIKVPPQEPVFQEEVAESEALF